MAKHWTPLPKDLPAAHAALVDELRRLKDRSGLSLARLAVLTNYSRSSWERWLNGKRPVPLVAVESMAKACTADSESAVLLKLWRRQRLGSVGWKEERAEGAGKGAGGGERVGPGAQEEHAEAEQGQGPGTWGEDQEQTAAAGVPTVAEADVAGAKSEGRQRVLPRQLPCAPRHFVGRAAALKELADVIAHRGGGDGDGYRSHDGPTLLALDGIAGIGKTALAIRWAHQVADQFPDGQLYTNLRGFDPSDSPMKPVEAIRGFLSAFQVPPDEIPADLDAQAALYRSLLSDKRILLVLDNARDAEQVRPLLPGSATCLTVVTSRSRLTGLAAVEGARLLPLPLLSGCEAYQLLTAHIGSVQAMAQEEAVKELIVRCAGLPLALSIIGARSAAQPNFPLAAIVDELRETATLMNALNSGDAIADVRTVFSWSYRYLSPAAARLFRLLGTHPGPDVSAPAAASMAGIPADEARRALYELTQANLLEEHAPGRFTFHDLLRAYAAELAGLVESDAERHEATHRMLDHYQHTASGAVRELTQVQAKGRVQEVERIQAEKRVPAKLSQATAQLSVGVVPEELPDYNSALQWFDVERPVLLAAIELAARNGFDAHTWQITCALGPFLDRRTHWHNWLASERTALAAVHRLGDLHGEARTRHDLSKACIRFRLHNEAREHLRHALNLYQHLEDPIRQAEVHLDLGRSFNYVRAHDEAITHATQALVLFSEHGQRAGQAAALNFIGAFHAHHGNLHIGLSHCGTALSLFRELGHAHGQAEAWANLGSIHHQFGHPHLAMDCYRHAVDLFAELGDRHNQASSLAHLGEVQRATGNADSAHTAWERALTILDDLHHPAVEDVRARLRRDLSRPRRMLTQQHGTANAAGARSGTERVDRRTLGGGGAPESQESQESPEPVEQRC